MDSQDLILDQNIWILGQNRMMYRMDEGDNPRIIRLANQENSQDCHEGDSDDEIAELRFQALLTKRENEAEVSPAHEPRPRMDNLSQKSMNQPLSNYRNQNPYHQYNVRGRGYKKQYFEPYLQNFSQQMASSSVNSSNIVVLTSSNDSIPGPFQCDRGRGRGRPRGMEGRFQRGRDNYHSGIPSHGSSGTQLQNATPQLVLPQDKYAVQTKVPADLLDTSKTKLSARMRRLQGSGSDSDDSETDSSDDSSSDSSSSDSNTSSSDSSSSGTDSESEDSSAPTKKLDKAAKKEKVGNADIGLINTHPPSNIVKNGLETQNKPSGQASSSIEITAKSVKNVSTIPLRKGITKLKSSSPHQPISSPEKPSYPHSPLARSKSPDRKYHSPPRFRMRSRTPTRYRSPSPRIQRFKRNSSPYSSRPFSPIRSRSPAVKYSISPKYKNQKSKSPIHAIHSPIRRVGKRRLSKSPIHVTHSPLRRLGSKSPISSARNFSPLSPVPARYKSRSKSPIVRTRYISRSPVHRRNSLSPRIRRLSRSRSPYVTRRIRPGSKSPGPVKYKSRSPRPLRRYSSRSPVLSRRYGSNSPAPFRKLSKSPIHRAISPFSQRHKSRSISPRRHSPNRVPIHSPYFKSKDRSPFSPKRWKSPVSPRIKRFASRSPRNSPIHSKGLNSPLPLLKRAGSPHFGRRSLTPQAIRRVGSISPVSHVAITKLSSYGSPTRKRTSPKIRKLYGSISPKRVRSPLRRPVSPVISRGSPLKNSQFPRHRPISPRDQRLGSRSPPYINKRHSPLRRPNSPVSETRIGFPQNIKPYYGNEAEKFSGSHPSRANAEGFADYNPSHKREPSPLRKRYLKDVNPLPQWNHNRAGPTSLNFSSRHSYAHTSGPPQGPDVWASGPPGTSDRNFNLPPRGPPQLNRNFDQSYRGPPSGQLDRNYDLPYIGPSCPPERNFDMQNRGPPRPERLIDNMHNSQSYPPGRGRGNMRGFNRGFPPRGGVYSRVSAPARGQWSQHQNESRGLEPGPPQEKYFKEPLLRGPSSFTSVGRFDEKEFFSDRSPAPEKFISRKSPSPLLKRKGPQTPPDPPKRDPSPLEYQKRLNKARTPTPSLSPSPSRKLETFSKIGKEIVEKRKDNFVNSEKNKNAPHKAHNKDNLPRKDRDKIESRREAGNSDRKRDKVSTEVRDRNFNESIEEHVKRPKETRQDVTYKEHCPRLKKEDSISHEIQHKVSRYPRPVEEAKEGRSKNFIAEEKRSNERFRDVDRGDTEFNKGTIRDYVRVEGKLNTEYPRAFERSNKNSNRDSNRFVKSTRPLQKELSSDQVHHSHQEGEREKVLRDPIDSKTRTTSKVLDIKERSKDKLRGDSQERRHLIKKSIETEIKNKIVNEKPPVKPKPKEIIEEKDINIKKNVKKEETKAEEDRKLVIIKSVKNKRSEMEIQADANVQKKVKPKKSEKKKLKEVEEKKKKKKKHKDEDKKPKKVKKEKKKKKESKKHKKLNKTSESEEETPLKKKEKIPVRDNPDEDLRHTLMNVEKLAFNKERESKRKREPSMQLNDKRRRDEETEWLVRARVERDADDYYESEDRYREDYKIRRTDREKDNNTSRENKGYLVTVGSNIDRQVLLKGGRVSRERHMQILPKGSDMEIGGMENPRGPVRMRLSLPEETARSSENADRISQNRKRNRDEPRPKRVIGIRRGSRKMDRRPNNR